jgi:hypothetical protein
VRNFRECFSCFEVAVARLIEQRLGSAKLARFQSYGRVLSQSLYDRVVSTELL